jgi:ribosomal protein S18 acetylase RimI-like enzyme
MIKILRSTDKELKEFGKKEWTIANLEHYGKKVDYNQKDFIFKAIEDGKTVGSVKGSHEAGVIYINYLIVAHNKKGLGVGKKLSLKAEEFGKRLGAHKVHLITGKGWSAEKFYQKLGYEKVALLPSHHFKSDFVIYEKSLS